MQLRFRVFVGFGLLMTSLRIQAAPPPLALTGGTVWSAADALPVRDAVVVIRDGVISAIGPRSQVTIPSDCEQIDCTGKTVVPGFWNSHVHFTEPKWHPADSKSAQELSKEFEAMLTRFGFTTVVDLASMPANTFTLRKRIESGEVAGPRILTAGAALYPANGIPFYVTESLPPESVASLPAPATPEEAVSIVRTSIASGTDLIKLFLVTGVRKNGRIELVTMDPAIARAAVEAAHAAGLIAAAHPSNQDGIELALAAGVDVLAHTSQEPGRWTPEIVSRLKNSNTSLIPTLTLFRRMSDFAGVLDEVKTYRAAGGVIVFGTDVGFLSNYGELQAEFDLLAQSGLTPRDVLASLTTAPAQTFKRANHSGRLERGYDADLVVLDGEPGEDIRLFTRVVKTIARGVVIYPRTESKL